MDIRKQLEGQFPLGTSEYSQHVSIESFSRVVARLSDFFSRKTKKSVLDEVISKWGGYKDPKRVVDLIRNTYLNPSWMGRQQLVEGAIEVEDIGPYLVLDSSLEDPIENLRQVQGRVNKLVAWLNPRLKTFDGEIRRIDQTLQQDYAKLQIQGIVDRDEADRLWETGLAEVLKLRDPLNGYPFDSVKYLGDIQLVRMKSPIRNGFPPSHLISKSPTRPKVIPSQIEALDMEGVTLVAQMMVDILEGSYVDQLHLMEGTDHSDRIEFNRYDSDSNAYQAYYDATYYQNLWDFVDSPFDRTNTLKTLNRWISRSVA